MDILGFIIIGIVAGWIAGNLMKGAGFGLLGNLIVGIVGAVVGGFLFGALGVETESPVGALVMATVGAIVLLFLVSMFTHSGSRHHRI